MYIIYFNVYYIIYFNYIVKILTLLEIRRYKRKPVLIMNLIKQLLDFQTAAEIPKVLCKLLFFFLSLFISSAAFFSPPFFPLLTV